MSQPAVEELEPRNLLATGGFTPSQILTAYGFTALYASEPAGFVAGAGETIAVVEAYKQVNLQTDINTFDSMYGLPAITLNIINDGATKSDPTGGWDLEAALDVEWAHAIAPGANIDVVEAANDDVNSAGVPTALLNAVKDAVSQPVTKTQPPVRVVSMSWGVPEFKTEAQYDSYFNVPGVTFVAASGDSGAGTIYPAVSPNVVAVGGTTLEATSNPDVFTEVGWGNGNSSAILGGSGGGVSTYEAEPSYQQSTITTVPDPSSKRLSPDVSYDADPSPGVEVYDKTNDGWLQVGGTSAGTPQFAALVAVADQLGGKALSSSQTLAAVYKDQADFYDITSGTTGYSAGVGYDLVSGLGSPQANKLIPDLANGTTTPASADPFRTAASTTGNGGGGGGGGSGHGHWGGSGRWRFTTSDSSANPVFFISPNLFTNIDASGIGTSGSQTNSLTQYQQVLAGQNNAAGSQRGTSAITYGREQSTSGLTPLFVRVGETDDNADDADPGLPVIQQPGGAAQPLRPAPGGLAGQDLGESDLGFADGDFGFALGMDFAPASDGQNGSGGEDRAKAIVAAAFAALGTMTWGESRAEEARKRQISKWN
jgi:hypothetical protein